MKKIPGNLPILLILLLAFFLLIALSAHKIPSIPQTSASFGAAAFFVQTTPTPSAEDVSEIGSTDGIVLMGVVIVMVVVVPILLRRKTWSES